MVFFCSNTLEMKIGLKALRIIGVAFSATTAIPTTVLNSLVLLAVWKTPALHKPSQILLANLALTDLLIGVVTCPYMAYLHLAAINNWVPYKSFCYFFTILGGLSLVFGGVSLYTLALISIDRFLAVKLKFAYESVATKKRFVIALLCGWLTCAVCYAIAISVIILFLGNVPRIAFLVFFVIYIAVFLCINTIFYSLAFYHLKKLTLQVTTCKANNSTSNAASSFDITKYRRSLHTMVIVLLALFIFFLPYCCNAALQSAFEHEIFTNLDILTPLLALSNSCVNPLLYLWRMQDLRQAVKNIVRGCFRH